MHLENKTVGLALGSGAARGLAHIGILQVLSERNVNITGIAGTSIGALIGALYASGMPVSQMEEVAANLNWRSFKKLIGPIIPTSGLIDGQKVLRFLDEFLPARRFEDLQIPLALTATDIESGKLVVMRKGDLRRAIQAAIAFPGIFQPVYMDNRFLVDGGLCAPVPTDIATEMGPDVVIGVCTIPEVEKNYSEVSTPGRKIPGNRNHFLERLTPDWIEKRFGEIWRGESSTSGEDAGRRAPGILRVFSQSIAIMENQINALRLQQDDHDLLVRPRLDRINLLDFHRARDIMQAGRQAMAAALQTETPSS